jgi:5-methyltetrahydropteroyltriglutamate--homocysteine methyltransferase
MAVRTTVVGSWWPLPEHEDALSDYHHGRLSAEDGERVLRDAATAAIAEQRDLGLDEWTGGEYHTHNFIYHMHSVLEGIEIDKPEAEDPFDYDDMAHARIVGEISAPNGLGYLSAYEREKDLPGGVNKTCVVAPYEVAVAGIADQLDEIRRQSENLTRIVNDEMRAIADAGCPTVQLDAPIFGIQVNVGLLTAKEAADLIAPCFAGVTARKAIHICNGNMRGRPQSRNITNAAWVDILQHLDGVIDVAVLECSYFPQWMDREAFRELPQSMELAAGIVDEASYWVEPTRKIRERAADWARVVGEERLWLCPSCGFGRHPARNVPVLRAKMENMVEAAQTL